MHVCYCLTSGCYYNDIFVPPCLCLSLFLGPALLQDGASALIDLMKRRRKKKRKRVVRLDVPTAPDTHAAT